MPDFIEMRSAVSEIKYGGLQSLHGLTVMRPFHAPLSVTHKMCPLIVGDRSASTRTWLG